MSLAEANMVLAGIATTMREAVMDKGYHDNRRHDFTIIVVSDEGRELNAHRIQKCKLAGLVNVFVSSCFVHLRKPDPGLYRLALDIAQVPARHILYLDDTPMFVQIAQGLGIRGILHTDYQSICAKLASFGFLP